MNQVQRAEDLRSGRDPGRIRQESGMPGRNPVGLCVRACGQRIGARGVDEDGLVADLRVVRVKGVARTDWRDIPALRATSGGMSLEDFLRVASEKLDPFDTEGVRIALGIGGHGLGRSSADRRADFATHYRRTAETVRRKDGIEDQVFRKLAREILREMRETHQPESRAQSTAPSNAPAVNDRVRIGRAPEVGPGYQRRGFDDEMEQIWTDGGDRRVWLRGQPGLGKSYTARRVAQEADESLVIWVESAGPDAVRAAFSQATERMPQLGLSADASDPERVHTQAENLLREFESSGWTWLVILDNADIKALLDAHLIPTGRNPNGRVLITAVGEDARMTQHGRIVRASPFTDLEAEEYLRSRVDTRDGQRAALSSAAVDDLSRLARALGHHPLALSTASATITANHHTVAEWIAEFQQAARIDDAADEQDTGGYPHTIGRTFRLALEKASAGLPSGVVQRAAAVAAVQDPDGHPTWQWDRMDVRTWVAGAGELETRHGRPVVVDRLRAYGLIEVVGDAWTGGRLAMHQLAARALREAIPVEDLTRIGVILTLEWLANLVVDDAFLGPNIAALLEHTDVDETPARVVAGGLATFAGVLEREADADVPSIRSRELKETLAQYRASEGVLAHLGPRSKHFLALQAAFIAQSFRTLGDAAEAIRYADRATALYEEIVADPATPEKARADALVELSEHYEAEGHKNQARKYRAAAADQYERLLLASATPADRIDWVTQLAQLAEELGEPDRAFRVRASFTFASELLSYTPTGNHDAYAHGARLKKLAKLQVRLGSGDDAKLTYVRAAEVYREYAHEQLARDVDLERLSLIVAAGEWNEAEVLITRLLDTAGRDQDRTFADDLMRLASARTHLPEPEQAVEAVARAIDIYRAVTARDVNERSSGADDDEDPGRHGLGQLRLLGALEEQAGRLDEAFEIYGSELARRESVRLGEFEDELADTYYRLGLTAYQLNRYSEAADHLASAVRIYEMLVALTPEAALQQQLTDSLLPLALAQRDLGDTGSAIQTNRRLVAVRTAIVGADPSDVDAQAKLCDAMEFLAEQIAEDKDDMESIELLESSLRIRRSIANIVGTDAAQVALAGTLQLLGNRLASTGRHGRADTAWAEQIRILETHDDRRKLADALLAQGTRFLETDDERAIALIERGAHELEQVVATAPDDLMRMGRLAAAHLILAMLYEGRGAHERQGAQLSTALEFQTRVCAADPGDLNSQAFAAVIRVGLADWLRTQDRLDQSIPHFDTAVSTFQLLLDLKFEMVGLAQQLHGTLQSLRDVLRAVHHDMEADELEARIEDLERDYPDLDSPNVS